MSDIKVVGSHDLATRRVHLGQTVTPPLYTLPGFVPAAAAVLLPFPTPGGALAYLPDANGGDGAIAYAGGNPVTAYVVTNGGSGYTVAPVVTVIGDGVGATATATVLLGVVTAVNVVNGGFGYTVPPAVSFGGPGKGAAATATVAAPEWRDVGTNALVA